ncbi:MAG: PAS domain S-box protein [Salinivirgaceae bacterium]
MSKTKEELIKELLKLKQEYNALKASYNIDINECKRSEKLLKHSENQSNMILESAGEGILGIDCNGNHTFVNPKAAYLLGYEIGEMIGKNSHSLWHYSSANGAASPCEDCPIYETLKDGKKHQGESYFIRKDGTGFYVDYTCVPIYDSEIIVGAVVTFFDITERKQVHNEIIKLKRAVETSGEAIIITDINGTITYINPEFTAVYGYTPDEVIGKTTPRILKSGVMNDDNYKDFWNTILSNQVLKGELINKTKDGRLLTIEGSANSIRNQNNEIIGFIAIQHDITQRKHEEQELRESEEKYRLITENTADTISIYDLNLRCTFVSPSVLKLRGYTTKEAIKHTLDKVLTAPSLQKAKQSFTKQIALEETGKEDPSRTVSIELEEYCKDGSIIWVELVASFIRDFEQKPIGILTITRDITNRKKMESSIQQQLSFANALNNIAGVIISTQESTTIIEKTTHILGETLGVDRCLIYDVNFRNNQLTAASEWLNPKYQDIQPTKGVYPIDIFISGISEMNKTKHYLVSHFDEINPVLLLDNSDKILHNIMEIKSALWYPFSFYAEGYNLLVLNETHHKREWKCEEIDFLNSVSKQVGIALEKINLLEEKKEANKRIEASELIFRTIADFTYDWEYWENQEHKIIYMSPSCERVTGYSLDEFMTDILLLDKISHPDDKEFMRAHHENDFNGNKNAVDDVEFRIIKKDNSIIYLQHICRPIFDLNNKFLGRRVSNRDITERKLAGEVLRQSEERWRSIVENEPECVKLLDHEGRLLEMNPAGLEMIQATLEQVQGKKVVDFVAEEDQAYFNEMIEGVLRGETRHLQFAMVGLGGKRLLMETTSVQLKYSSSAGNTKALLAVTRDITERKRAEQELIVAKEHAEESDRLKTAFLCNMSHEIRTPMNGILGFAEILKEPDITGQQQLEYLGIIEKSGRRMLNIINNIVDISKIEAGLMKVEKKESNINEQIEFIYNCYKPEVEAKGMKLFYKNALPANQATIKTDPDKIYAILTNLIENAIKYSETGIIEFGYSFVGKLPANHIQFFVKDTGIGIPKDRLEAVFERFIQADIEDEKLRQGAGLGLSIAKSYIEMMGGKIWVESEVNKGSKFSFTLPLYL